VPKCPEGAIIVDKIIKIDELTLQPVRIDPKKCTDCRIYVSEEY